MPGKDEEAIDHAGRTPKELSEQMQDAADEIIEILKEYDFNTIQGNLLLNRVGKAIRQAQAEKSVSD